jgi:hypothetical protein
MTYGWNVFVVESMHGLGNASSLEGTCTSPPKRFWRGQRRMMREVWTSGADGSMKSGLGRCRVLSFASKGSTLLRSTLLCSWWRYSDNGAVPCLPRLRNLAQCLPQGLTLSLHALTSPERKMLGM